eukprot:gene8700-1089_t
MPREPCLTREHWESYFAEDGRVLNQSEIRKRVFAGGLAEDVRQEVWFFLLGVYPFLSTSREREVLLRSRRMEYRALKEHWKETLRPDKSYCEFLLIFSSFLGNCEGNIHPYTFNSNLQSRKQNTGHDYFSAADDLDPEDQFTFIQAKITAMSHRIDEEHAEKSIVSLAVFLSNSLSRTLERVIEKDVPRTDRETDYFKGDDNIHLEWLHDILVTYAVFHPEVGYVQGMNDVLSIILPVMDDEANAYWCFAQYLETIQKDFMATGMVENLRTLEDLVDIMDPDLRKHLIDIDAGEMIYCHRWLLLGFKREFSQEDALKLFEILCSHHLELSSIEAQRERSKERRHKRQQELGGTELAPQERSIQEEDTFETKFKFALFVCIAILEEYRGQLFQCESLADVFQLINSLSEKMDLDTILLRSEEAFFRYCRNSVHSTSGANSYLLKS